MGHAKVEPSQQVLACADGADVLMKLNWSHWGAQALATGSEAINDCTPTCVGGTFHKFPVITVLWRVRPRPHHSAQMMFTRATIIYTGTIPAGSPPHPHDPAVRLASKPPAEPPASAGPRRCFPTSDEARRRSAEGARREGSAHSGPALASKHC